MAAEKHRKLNALLANELINNNNNINSNLLYKNKLSVPLVSLYHTQFKQHNNNNLSVDLPLASTLLQPSKLCYIIQYNILILISYTTIYIVQYNRNNINNEKLTKGRNGYNISIPIELEYNIIDKYNINTYMIQYTQLNAIKYMINNDNNIILYIVDSAGDIHVLKIDSNDLSDNNEPPTKQRKLHNNNLQQQQQHILQYQYTITNEYYKEFGHTQIDVSNDTNSQQPLLYTSCLFSNIVQCYDTIQQKSIYNIHTQHMPYYIHCINNNDNIQQYNNDILAIAETNIVSLYDIRQNNNQHNKSIITIQQQQPSSYITVDDTCITTITSNNNNLLAFGSNQRNVYIYDIRYTSKQLHIWQRVTKHSISYIEFSTLTDKQLYVADDNELVCGSYIHNNINNNNNNNGVSESVAFRAEGKWLGITKQYNKDTIYAISNAGHMYILDNAQYMTGHTYDQFIDPASSYVASNNNLDINNAKHVTRQRYIQSMDKSKEELTELRAQRKVEAKLLKQQKAIERQQKNKSKTQIEQQENLNNYVV